MENTLSAIAGIALSALTLSVSPIAKADCPTDALDGFAGNFSGVMTQLGTDGALKSSQVANETHTVIDCDTFAFKVQYLDAQGAVVREVAFMAAWDAGKSLFKMSGTNIDGVLRVIKEHTYLATFSTAFPVGPVTCDEMMSLTNENKDLARSVHCRIGGADGPLYGTRSLQSFRIAD